MNNNLYKLISDFKADIPQEIQDKKIFLEYIKTFHNILSRENNFAHITSSPWIMNKERTKVLMIYHNIYQSWSWCGGHADGEEDLLFVALKEGKEETGITHLTPLSNKPIAIDILPVNGHFKKEKFVSSHIHLNVTYLCIADENELLHIKSDENSAVQWININELNNFVTEENMLHVYNKLINKTKQIKNI